MVVTVSDVLSMLDTLAPFSLAEAWDNVGLLVGDANAQVHGILTALDATLSVIDQATAQGADLIVTHHPLRISPMTRLVEDCGSGTLIRRLTGASISLIAAHTNLDSAPKGLNTYVAEMLGLLDTKPLHVSESRPFLKLVVYVPSTSEYSLCTALAAAGAGAIGDYSECTFASRGEGTFRPGEGTHPYIGAPGELTRVPETRFETIVPRSRVGAVVKALYAAHPYEAPAFDLLPLENCWPGAGLGRIGKLPKPETAAAFSKRVVMVLGTDRLDLVGDPSRQVQTIALCTGGGGNLVEEAAAAGADLYLTGEMKHSQALAAAQRGLCVLTAEHFATERPAVSLLAEWLTKAFPDVPVHRAEESDPLVRVSS